MLGKRACVGRALCERPVFGAEQTPRERIARRITRGRAKTLGRFRVRESQPQINAGLDALFGNLGQDFVDSFKSFTLDFVNMTFSVEI